VPVTAIQRGTLGTFVLVVQEDKTVRTQKVQLLALQGDQQAIQIPEGQGALRLGQWVVTDGADRLRDNSRVEVVKVNGKNIAAETRGGPGGGQQLPGKSGVPDLKTGEGKAQWANPQVTKNSPAVGGSGSNRDQTAPASSASPSSVKGPEGVNSPVAGGPQGGQGNPSAAPAGADGSPERPRWMDRLPPEMVDRIKAMSPEERRAFFQKLRERRQSQSE
jgi:multidrug efflux system membrane fusion protein